MADGDDVPVEVAAEEEEAPEEMPEEDRGKSGEKEREDDQEIAPPSTSQEKVDGQTDAVPSGSIHPSRLANLAGQEDPETHIVAAAAAGTETYAVSANPLGVDPLSLPPSGSELYVGGISKNFGTPQVHALFSPYGDIHEVRVPTEPGSILNKGFGFVMFKELEHAQAAQRELNGKHHEGLTLKVSQSLSKNRLFVGNIPKSMSPHTLEVEFRHKTRGVVVCEFPQSTDMGNRGYCFIEYYNHEAALAAKELISMPNFDLCGTPITPTCRMAESKKNNKPSNDFNSANLDMSRCRTVFVKGLTQYATEPNMADIFSRFGEVESAYIAPPRNGQYRDFGFVYFRDKRGADAAVQMSQRVSMDNVTLEISLARNADAAKGYAPARQGPAAAARESTQMFNMMQGGGAAGGAAAMPGFAPVYMPDGQVAYMPIQSMAGAGQGYDTANYQSSYNYNDQYGGPPSQLPGYGYDRDDRSRDRDGYGKSGSRDDRYGRRSHPYG